MIQPYFFTENLVVIELIKNLTTHEETCLFRTVIVEMSKREIYEFWYDYVKPIYGVKLKLCYMDTVSFYTL